jgi:tetraacyldisaccharide 4'-kinase
VGNPEGFRTTVLDTGAHLAGFVPFRDHHRFTERELSDLGSAAAGVSARYIVTTEKDAVRIARFPAAATFLALRIRMEIPEMETLVASIRALVPPR